MIDKRTQNREKLQTLLRQLFQFDAADLDFGIYHILNHKRDEIERFIERELIDAIAEGLALYQARDREELEAKLAEKREQLGSAAFDESGAVQSQFKDLPIAQEYVKLWQAWQQLGLAAETEARIFNDLVTFFSRYYDNGDFLSKRRYSSQGPKYYVPYNGEEVMFHWANRDQYYVKTGEHFTDYRFTTGDYTVWFRLEQASTPQNNVKGDARYFTLRPERPLSYDASTQTLAVYFEYRPLNEAEESRFLATYNKEQRKSNRRSTLDRNVICLALEGAILEQLDEPTLKAYLAAVPRGQERSTLNQHLNRYTARNTMDYFVHKDLGGFLRQELDFFLKNEVLKVDDIAGDASAETLQLALVRMRVVRQIAEKVIAFLAQIEGFQKRLFEKKKFVVQSDYCVTLDRVPEALYAEILANEAQLANWQDLYRLDEWPRELSWSGEIDEAFLKDYPYLMLDTAYFDADFKARLLVHFVNLDEAIDGVLFHSENFQALNVLQVKYGSKIKCIYIDPPYNTNASEIVYKNNYKHSSWLALMVDRLQQARQLLKEDGVLCVTIDDVEIHRLAALLQDVFDGEEAMLGTIAIRSNPSGRSTPKSVSIAHEYAILVAGGETARVGRLPRTESQRARYSESDDRGAFEWVNFRKHGGADAKREARPRMFYPVFASEDGNVRIPEMQWDTSKKQWMLLEQPLPDEMVLLPVNVKGEEMRWKWGYETVLKNLSDFCARPDQTGELGVYMKSRMRHEGILPLTWWDNKKYSATEYGTNLLTDILGESQKFSFPKSVYATKDCLKIATLDEEDSCVDFFAGSGTTAHAVMMLNREDGGRRKYILVEMDHYFDTTLKPRIQKVAFSANWKDGVPQDKQGQSHMFKYQRLESYEDALNNIQVREPESGQRRLLYEEFDDYLLSYMLDFEAQDSPTLLTQDAFQNPSAYKLNIQNGHETPRPTAVDLVETFHYLIGLHVRRLERHRHQDRFYTVSRGDVVMPNGIEKVVVIWRDTEGLDLAQEADWANTTLLTEPVDRVYVNGPSHIENAEPLEITFRERLEGASGVQ